MSADRAQPVKEQQPAATLMGPEVATAGQPTAGSAWALLGFDARIFASGASNRPRLTAAQVMTLQRLAGNAAVSSLFDRRLPGRFWNPRPRRSQTVQRANVRQRGRTPVAIQRQDPAEAPAETEMTPEQRIDEATFAGFNAWAEAAIADADDTCVDAARTANRLESPYQHRLNMLIEDVVDVRNPIDDGKYALGQGHPVPGLTSDPEGRLFELEDRINDLRDVTDAWDNVMSSGLVRLLAAIARSQVDLARRLARELDDLLRELRELQRIASGAELNQAFAQLGLNAAITVAVVVLTALVPPAGVALAVGSAVVQLTLDACLATPPGAMSYGASGTSIASAPLTIRRFSPQLRTAGRRLGAVGQAAGTVSDVLETREAIINYENAGVRLRAVSARIDRIVPQLDRLLPILAHPDLVEQMIEGLSNHADTLRENGQVTLAAHGQL